MTILIDKELENLKELNVEMMLLTKSQLEKARQAIFEFNTDLAEEIIRVELRVNAEELNIEKECENIIALYQPVATDLRFMLAVIKSVSDLERIADHADAIAKMLLDRSEAFDKRTLEVIQLKEMFDKAFEMFDDVIDALTTHNTALARKVFKKDKDLDKIFKVAVKNIGAELSKADGHKKGLDLLSLYSVLAKIERTGDLLTNVGEEIVFYLDAEVLKHKKKNKKIQKFIDKSTKA